MYSWFARVFNAGQGDRLSPDPAGIHVLYADAAPIKATLRPMTAFLILDSLDEMWFMTLGEQEFVVEHPPESDRKARKEIFEYTVGSIYENNSRVQRINLTRRTTHLLCKRSQEYGFK